MATLRSRDAGAGAEEIERPDIARIVEAAAFVESDHDRRFGPQLGIELSRASPSRSTKAKKVPGGATAPPGGISCRCLNPTIRIGTCRTDRLATIPDQAPFEPNKETPVSIRKPASSFSLAARSRGPSPFRSSGYLGKTNRSIKSPMAGELTGIYGLDPVRGLGRLSRLRLVIGVRPQFASMNLSVET